MPSTAILTGLSVDQELTCVCCHCQRTQTESGEWEPRYLPEDELVSHGICPDCYREFYPGYPLPRALR